MLIWVHESGHCSSPGESKNYAMRMTVGKLEILFHNHWTISIPEATSDQLFHLYEHCEIYATIIPYKMNPDPNHTDKLSVKQDDTDLNQTQSLDLSFIWFSSPCSYVCKQRDEEKSLSPIESLILTSKVLA